jgi:hypothetical protein
LFFERTKTTGTNRFKSTHPASLANGEIPCMLARSYFLWKKRMNHVTFRRNYQRDILIVRTKNELEVLPDGGNIE